MKSEMPRRSSCNPGCWRRAVLAGLLLGCMAGAAQPPQAVPDTTAAHSSASPPAPHAVRPTARELLQSADDAEPPAGRPSDAPRPGSAALAAPAAAPVAAPPAAANPFGAADRPAVPGTNTAAAPAGEPKGIHRQIWWWILNITVVLIAALAISRRFSR